MGGEIIRNLDGADLRQRLSQLLGPPQRGFGRIKAKTATASGSLAK
jgi:hypothetical protein